MSILLTNDDGVDAPGLLALVDALRDLDDLYIAAPVKNCSGVGGAITLDRNLSVIRYPDWPGVVARTAIDGTPVDAVKYGIRHLLEDNPPRLVVSGINHGPNIGRNVRCSGTVNAAFEALLFDVPALAVSVEYLVPPVWDGAIHYTRLVAEHALDLAERRRDFVLNLNVPGLDPDQIHGLFFAPQGRGGYNDFLARIGTGDTFEPDGDWVAPEGGVHCDASAFTDGYAVLTPMRYEQTHDELLAQLESEWGHLDSLDVIWPEE